MIIHGVRSFNTTSVLCLFRAMSFYACIAEFEFRVCLFDISVNNPRMSDSQHENNLRELVAYCVLRLCVLASY